MTSHIAGIGLVGTRPRRSATAPVADPARSPGLLSRVVAGVELLD